MLKKIIYYSLFTIFLLNCEKDDICLDGTPGTPRLIIRFFDHDERITPKSLSNTTIKAISNDEVYTVFSGDSLGIPLKLISNSTKFDVIAFEKKNHFGPGYINVSDIDTNNKILSQIGSEVIIDNKLINPKKFDTKDFY